MVGGPEREREQVRPEAAMKRGLLRLMVCSVGFNKIGDRLRAWAIGQQVQW